MEVLPQYCKEAVKEDNLEYKSKCSFVAIMHCFASFGPKKLVQSHAFFQVGSEFPLITNLELVRRLNKIGRDSPGFVDIKFPWKEVLFLLCYDYSQNKYI